MSNGAWDASIGFAVLLISKVAIFNAFNNKVRVCTFYDNVFLSVLYKKEQRIDENMKYCIDIFNLGLTIPKNHKMMRKSWNEIKFVSNTISFEQSSYNEWKSILYSQIGLNIWIHPNFLSAQKWMNRNEQKETFYDAYILSMYRD